MEVVEVEGAVAEEFLAAVFVGLEFRGYSFGEGEAVGVVVVRLQELAVGGHHMDIALEVGVIGIEALPGHIAAVGGGGYSEGGFHGGAAHCR